MKVVELTMKETKKYQVIKAVVEGRRSLTRATIELNLGERQIRRLVTKYQAQGKAGFRHGNAGKQPSNRITTATKNKIVHLYETKYAGFNIKHFFEFLVTQEEIKISESSLRRILRARHCLSPKAHKATKRAVRKELKAKEVTTKTMSQRETKILQEVDNIEPIKAHPSRSRKKNAGELIQMDASWEFWLGPNQPKITLHVAIDDATGTLVGASFTSKETLAGYYQVMDQILRNYGAPYEILTDRRTVFTANKKAGTPGLENPLTTFGYACQTLGTQLSVTSIPQAKGRVERVIETLQSRLSNELKLAQVSTIEAANQFLESFLARFNHQFALPLDGITSVFDKQLSTAEIEHILIIARERTITKGHTLQLDNQTYQTFRNNQLICLPPHTKVLAIKAFSGALYATDQANNIYDLHLLPDHVAKSPAFEVIIEKPATKSNHRQPAKPAVDHPWRLMNYRDYLSSLGKNKYKANHIAYQPS